MTKLLFFLSFALFSGNAISQVYNYVHYDVKEGLAGSTVYDISQDPTGFLWFATDNGLSKFDGTRFTTYTVADGLPDNEVLKILADAKGRIWIGTNTKGLSYFKGDRVYNRLNDSTLNHPLLNFQALGFLEDREDNLYICDYKDIVMLDRTGTLKSLKTIFYNSGHQFSNIGMNPHNYGSGILVSFNDSIFIFDDMGLKFLENSISNKSNNNLFPNYFKSRQLPGENREIIFVPSEIISTYYLEGVPYIQSTIDGAWLIDTINNNLEEHFLAGKKVSRTLIDNEKNIWFSTVGDGVYKLASTEIKTIEFSERQGKPNNEVYTLAVLNHQILAGLGTSKMAHITGKTLSKISDFTSRTKLSRNSNLANRIYCSYTDSNATVFLGTDAFLAKIENDRVTYSDLVAIKSIENASDQQHLVIGTFSHALKLRKRDLVVVDTIWEGRCTEVYFYDGCYLIGTMNGLYCKDQNKIVTYLGDLHPALKRKISDIKSDQNGNVFIATVDMGLVVLRNGKVVDWRNDENGLSSNSCRSIMMEKSYLWLGTNNGICRVDLQDFKKILKYGISDGLPSGNINCILGQDSIIWVGSPAGLTYFDQSKVSSLSNCRLDLSVNSKGFQNTKGVYELSYKFPGINFDFVGISYRSGGDVEYYYRIIGLDINWIQTRQNNLSFSALPAGDYIFELYAVNKFGVKSEIKRVYFSISKSFWKSWQFYALLILVTILLTAWLVNRRSQVLEQRLIESQRFQRQLTDLEQQALQAQMNPQFIFDSLRSIQLHIQHNDKRMANEFLTGFAYLIRQTLDVSGKSTITLSEEMQFLQSFLNMEKLKGEYSLTYEFIVDDEVQTGVFEIPPLLLQPFLEKSIWNHLKSESKSTLKLIIQFKYQDNAVLCTISDNVTVSYEDEQNADVKEETQLKGLQLAKKRIDLLNELNQSKIQVMINNIMRGSVIEGSEIIIKIPVDSYATTD